MRFYPCGKSHSTIRPLHSVLVFSLVLILFLTLSWTFVPIGAPSAELTACFRGDRTATPHH